MNDGSYSNNFVTYYIKHTEREPLNFYMPYRLISYGKIQWPSLNCIKCSIS